ncbi:MAG TPA: hypothetical protein VHL98_19290 [Microvirga sp.]|jgi:hypothetical protein|nr:hypothetical protein [Microvirga sp.]
MSVARWNAANLADARRLCTTTRLSFAEISLRTGVARSTIIRHARRHGWRRGASEPAAPGPGPAFRANAAARRLDILARALALAERHIAEAEALRATPSADIAAREREAKFIATLVTLVQRHQQAEDAILAAAEDEASADARRGRAGEGDLTSDDAAHPAARSLDAVYRDFARHLAALLDGDAGAAAGPGRGDGGPALPEGDARAAAGLGP